MNWDDYLAAERPDLPLTFDSFIAALKELYAEFTPEFAAAETGVPAEQIVDAARAIGRAGSRSDAQLARRGGGQSLGLADHPLPVSARRPDRQRRRPSAASACTSPNKFVPKHPNPPPPPELLERAALPAGISARLLRDELSAAALPQGGARQDRRLLHARLQPAVDQPRRLLVDGDAPGSRARSACTSRSRRPGARPRGSPTTSCRWDSAPSATTR